MLKIGSDVIVYIHYNLHRDSYGIESLLGVVHDESKSRHYKDRCFFLSRGKRLNEVTPTIRRNVDRINHTRKKDLICDKPLYAMNCGF